MNINDPKDNVSCTYLTYIAIGRNGKCTYTTRIFPVRPHIFAHLHNLYLTQVRYGGRAAIVLQFNVTCACVDFRIFPDTCTLPLFGCNLMSHGGLRTSANCYSSRNGG